MSNVPSAASGRAAAATNWQSIFTVAEAIGAKLDADMRALALGGDPQVPLHFFTHQPMTRLIRLSPHHV